MHIVLTQEADDDLAGITTYTFNSFGRHQAERYVVGLRAFLLDLPTHRYRLRPVQSKTRGYWRAVYQSHVVFARKAEDALVIVRILHDKMNADHYLP